MNNIIDRLDLFCKFGSKDAVYHLQLVQVEGGYVVNFQNGRAGGTLKTGTKSPKGPGTLELARKTFDKIAKEKMMDSPPYIPMPKDGANSTPQTSFTHISNEMLQRTTGLIPELLNDIEPEDTATIEAFVNDPNKVAQQKYDGERRALKSTQGDAGIEVIGSNRKGLQVAIPVAIEQALLAQSIACVLDGEIIGDQFFAFELLEIGQENLRPLPYRERKARLNAIAAQFGPAISVAMDAHTPEEKRALIARSIELEQEGVVFKDLNAPHSEGRPNSGGPQRKLKNWKDCTVVCVRLNDDRRSVVVGVYEGANALEVGDVAGKTLIEVGSVSVPTNHALPKPGSLLDVKYLYGFDGGKLFQPQYKGERKDLYLCDAFKGQIKFKKPHVDLLAPSAKAKAPKAKKASPV